VEVALNLSTIIVALLLIGTILLQSKSSAFGGGMGGDAGSISKTRRGFEKTLFQFTIGTAVVFVILCVMSGLIL
jgi:preprotein translocase subunit SecG